MTSEAQYKGGYPNAENPVTEETQSFCIIIPAGEEYRQAAYAQLLMLGKWWKWKREESGTAAKLSAETWRQLFEFNEDCGGFLMTPEEYYDANKRSIYDAWNDIAKQVVSGRTTNINVDDEGTVSNPTDATGGAELPDNDPETPIDETQSAYYGGISEIAAKLEAVCDKADELYGATNGAPTTSEANAITIMSLYFPSDPNDMSAAVSSYYAYRTANNRLLFDRGTAFPLYLYCNGYDNTAQYKYLADISGFPFAKQQVINNLWSALSPEFYSRYFTIGQRVPSNAYLDAACVPMPYQEFADIPYASTRNLAPSIAKGSHRLKIRVSGYYVDPDGDLQDAFWYRTAAGILTRSNFTFSHAAGANMPSDNQVPYSTSHIYEYTIDLASGSSSWSVTFNRNAGMNVASTSPTNGFDIQITDVGLAVSA